MRTFASLSSLKGRKALLTGGAGHVGFAFARTLVELGARVAILDRDPKACLERAKELSRRRPGAAIALPCDLADEASTRACAREAVRRLGGLDILIHAAGFVGTTAMPGWAAPFERQSARAFEAALRVNLVSAFVLAQETRTALARSGKGSVILVSSIYGVCGGDESLYEGTAMANPAGYGASKAGLLQLTRQLATTFAPRVRVNAISPGGILRGQPKPFLERYRRRTPLRRLAREEDLQGALAYLASDLSAYVTGQNLLVDGGFTAW